MNLLLRYKCPIIEMTYEESELTKGYINTYLASISNLKFLSEICSRYSSKMVSYLFKNRFRQKNWKKGYYTPGLGI